MLPHFRASLWIKVLAVEAPTLMQRVLFSGEPGLLAGLIWSIALILARVPAIHLSLRDVRIWWERKVAGHMQSRPGPNRVGPMGMLQSLADGIKLMLKEDLRPAAVPMRCSFGSRPTSSFAPVFAAFLALPFGAGLDVRAPSLQRPVLDPGDPLVEVMGVILAGWASNNKWSVYGAMREACQMVTYEIPLGISIIVGVMAAGTLNMVELGHMQAGGIHTWLIYRNPFVFLAFFVYFVAVLARTSGHRSTCPNPNRSWSPASTPNTAACGSSFFFFAEYAAMFVVGGDSGGAVPRRLERPVRADRLLPREVRSTRDAT